MTGLPYRIDLMNQIDGVSFQQAWDNREISGLEYSDTTIEVCIMGLDPLIKNKEFVKRNTDLDDLQYLLEARIKREKAGQ